MEGENVSLAIAFGAGILSFISPCVLPLVPVYIAHLTGASASIVNPGTRRKAAFIQALFFVIGFTSIIVAIGASVGLIGYLMYDNIDIFRKIGGVVLVVMGLHTTGVFQIPLLYRDKHLRLETPGKTGYLSSLLVGVVFAVGWSPCIGPILGAIFALAFNSQTVWLGASLLAVYSLGLGMPFLATALAIGTMTRHLKRLNRHMQMIELASGLFLMAMGITIFADLLGRLSGLLSGLGIGAI
jgi:cytochrome c-type biogenesis protein